MPSFGIPYRLVGPDGSEAVFNEPENPNFVGYLNSENGITGLLDTPDVREGYFDKPESHGGVQTNSFFSKRSGTIQGFLIPDPTMLTFNRRESLMKSASRGMEAEKPSRLYWTPEGRPELVLRVYRQGKVSLTGRRPKVFVIPLASPDPFVLSASVLSATIYPVAGTVGEHGFGSPISSPFETEYTGSPNTGIVNAGDAETWGEYIFTGPMSNPIVFNASTNEQFQLIGTLLANERWIVNSRNRTVLLQPNIESPVYFNRYSIYAANFTSNQWFPLAPGSNLLQTSVTGGTAETTIVVNWQSAWE